MRDARSCIGSSILVILRTPCISLRMQAKRRPVWCHDLRVNAQFFLHFLTPLRLTLFLGYCSTWNNQLGLAKYSQRISLMQTQVLRLIDPANRDMIAAICIRTAVHGGPTKPLSSDTRGVPWCNHLKSENRFLKTESTIERNFFG
jgi:hypothetical protein